MIIGIAGPILSNELHSEMMLPVEKMPPGLGGSSVTTLVNSLWKQGCYLHVYSLDYGVDEECVFTGTRITVCFANYRERYRIWDFFRAERKGLSSLMRRYPSDLMHAHWTYEYAMAALDIRVPAVVTVRDWAPKVLAFMPNHYRLGRLLMNYYTLSKAKNIIANSEYIGNKMSDKLSFIDTIPNPIAKPEGYTCFEDKAQWIVSVNNGFNKLKNVSSLMVAFPEIQKMIPGCILHLVGTDYEFGGKAHRWASENGICVDGVEFYGKLPHHEVLTLIGKSRVMVHPSLEESFGNVLVEAMLRETVVVAGESSGAVPWVLDYGKAGFLVDVKNPSAISECVVWNAMSEKGKDMARKALSYSISKFSPEEIAKKHILVYRRMLTDK